MRKGDLDRATSKSIYLKMKHNYVGKTIKQKKLARLKFKI